MQIAINCSNANIVNAPQFVRHFPSCQLLSSCDVKNAQPSSKTPDKQLSFCSGNALAFVHFVDSAFNAFATHPLSLNPISTSIASLPIVLSAMSQRQIAIKVLLIAQLPQSIKLVI